MSQVISALTAAPWPVWVAVGVGGLPWWLRAWVRTAAEFRDYRSGR